MDTSLLDGRTDSGGRRFRRDDPALEREHAARLRAERVAADMARVVAAENRRAKAERARRLKAETTASAMAALVAHENARADRAERKLRELLEDS